MGQLTVILPKKHDGAVKVEGGIPVRRCAAVDIDVGIDVGQQVDKLDRSLGEGFELVKTATVGSLTDGL